MLQKHWKSWACPYRCGFHDTTDTSLRGHVNMAHRPVTQMELDVLIARCGQTQSPSSASPVNCPLCQDVLESIKHYQRHVGRHQVDLALFALPRTYEDDGEFDERDEDRETISTRSGSYSEATNDNLPAAALAAEEEYRNAELQEGTSIDDVAAHPASLVEWKSSEEHTIKRETSKYNEEGRYFGPHLTLHEVARPLGLETNASNRNKRGSLASGSSSNNNLTEGTPAIYTDSTTGAVGGKGIIPIAEAPLESTPGPGAVSLPRNLTIADSSESQHGDSKSAETSKSTGNEDPVDQSDHVNIGIDLLEPQVELLLMRRERERAQKEQKELEALKLAAKIDEEEKHREQLATEELELREAKKALDAMREDSESEESEPGEAKRNILESVNELLIENAKKNIALEKLRREMEARDAVEKYKKEEAEKRIREYKADLMLLREKEARDYLEKYRKEEAEKRKREDQINTVLEGMSIKGKGKKEEDAVLPPPMAFPGILYEEKPHPTYTRMARRHLSLETLRVYCVDYVLDQVSSISSLSL